MSVAVEASYLYDISGVDEHTQPMRSLPADAPDLDIVARAKAGDSHAFDLLVSRYRNDVYGLCYRFLRNREDAWDAAQEVFIKAHRGLARFRGDAAIKTWLLRIAANQCRDVIKGRRVSWVPWDDSAENTTVAPRANPGEAVQHAELMEAIYASIDGLSHKHRTTFILYEFEGLSYQEIADVMECNIGTVMSRLHNARKRLQQALVRQGYAKDGHDGEA